MSRGRYLLRTACLWLFLGAASGQAAEGEHFVESAETRKYAVILVGAAVDEERAQRFSQWGLSLRDSLRQEYGYAEERIRLLAASGEMPEADAAARREAIRETFAQLAERLGGDDQLSIFLFGHGTGRAEDAKFNIPGPDVSGPEFAQWVEQVPTGNIAVINTTSASHDFTRPLAANGRVLVSATRSAAEKYDTVFPGYFVEALQERAADRDKNGRLSLLEAFDYARTRVADDYRDQGILPSEHASLDDNGDGDFSTGGEGPDGRLAEVAYLGVPAAGARGLSEEARTLRDRMNELERDIFLLRGNKSSLSEADYWERMEPLLVELAETTRAFDELSEP